MATGSTSGSGKKVLGNALSRAGGLLKKLVYEQPAGAGGGGAGESFQERRASDRQQVVGDAMITLLDASGKTAAETRAFVRDTSEGGCGLWSRIAMPVGATVMVAMAAGAGGGSGGGGAPAQRVGRVRHCRGAEGTGFSIGVEFNKAKVAKAG